MNKIKWLVILLNLILLLVYFVFSVNEKERLLKSGHLILLKLVPIDPRSLMQGDYMSLRYDIAERVSSEKLPPRGYCVVRLDSLGVAERVRFQNDLQPLSAGEYLINYTAPDYWNVNIGAESYFFQEGQAAKYEKAKYGGIKIDQNGNSLLVGLYDEQRRKIE